jgi:hypothetical protein
METLTSIPFALDADRFIAQAHVRPGSSDATELSALVELAKEVGCPKAAYAVCFVTGRDSDEVRVEDACFRSRTLAHSLKSVERVFPILATCGHEMDERAPHRGDMLMEFWWDLIKAHLLAAASAHLSDHLHRRFRLGKTAIMRPGSGDASVWPIEQQKDLFALLGNVEEEIGVRLTDSFLMVPNKTTSGLMYPTETDFRSCGVCHRENCPGRHAAFNKELWEAIGHD